MANYKIISQKRLFFKIFHFFVWIIKKPVLPLPRLQSSYAGILILSMNGFFYYYPWTLYHRGHLFNRYVITSNAQERCWFFFTKLDTYVELWLVQYGPFHSAFSNQNINSSFFISLHVIFSLPSYYQRRHREIRNVQLRKPHL